MSLLKIRWTHRNAKGYVDVLPMSFFQSEIKNKAFVHKVMRPEGASYDVNCTVAVRRKVATLTYSLANNRRDAISPGVMRISFRTDERKAIHAIEWQDEGDAHFVDLTPIHTLEDDWNYFVIKTEQITQDNGSLSLDVRSIKKMGGDEISRGDRVFIWVFENKGGRGLEWFGTVRRLNRYRSNAYKIDVSNTQKTSSNFGTREINRFANSINKAEKGLFDKLKDYSLNGIRRIDQEEAKKLLSLFSFDLFKIAGKDETARLVRLGNIASRPNQSEFSAKIRRAYGGQCAVTGCSTQQALQAAHIRVMEGQDDNDVLNGILLRTDIHALFDAGLIALTLDGKLVDVSAKLSDSSYHFLASTAVSLPRDSGPSEANIRHHRLRFGFPVSKRLRKSR